MYTAFLYQATTGSCKKNTYFTSYVHSRHQSSNTHVRRVYCFTGIQLYRHTALQVHEENVEFHYGLRPLARPIRGSDPFDAHRSTRNPNRPSSAPRAYSPCRIALYPGRAPFWPPRGARRNLRMRYRLIRAVAKRRAHQSCIDRYGVLGRTVFAPPGWPRALEGESVLRPDRPPKANVRSPPDQMACFFSPAPRWRSARAPLCYRPSCVYNDGTGLPNTARPPGPAVGGVCASPLCSWSSARQERPPHHLHASARRSSRRPCSVATCGMRGAALWLTASGRQRPTCRRPAS